MRSFHWNDLEEMGNLHQEVITSILLDSRKNSNGLSLGAKKVKGPKFHSFSRISPMNSWLTLAMI